MLGSKAELSLRARAAYKAASSRASEIEGVIRRISFRVDVSKRVYEPAPEGTIWHVPLRNWAHPMALVPPSLLSENMEDARAYCEIADRFRLHSPLRALSFFCVPVGGGGDTTHAELHERIHNLHLTLCCVDSDRAYPDAPIGQTAARCRAELPTDYWFARLIVLEQRELENLLPSEWLRETDTGRQSPDIINALTQFDSAGSVLLRRHADLKSGFTSCELLRSIVHQVKESAIAELAAVRAGNARLGECLNARDCAHVAPCFSIEGLGQTLPRQLNAWLKSSSHKQTEAVSHDVALAPLAEKIFEWGVAASKMRA